MSRVFVAHDAQLGRKVVVKVLTPDLAAGVNATARATGSVAIGNAEVATDATGSFAFGDYSTGVRILATLLNPTWGEATRTADAGPRP